MRLRSIFGILLCLFSLTVGAMPAANAATALACPMVIAHKGNAFSGSASENSMNAFTNTFNLGIQWVETDVHFTSDSVPVLMHNPTVDDATDGTGTIAGMTAAKFTSLKLADGQHPPTLDQLMALILADPSHHLLLEMKATTITTAQEQILLSKLRGHEDQVHIYAFANRYPTVQHLKAADPAFTTSILGYDPILPPPAGIASEDLEYTYLTQARVDQLHAMGLKVKAWTPDNATAWASMRNMGVDVIITNKARDYMAWAKTTCPANPAPTAPTVSMYTPVPGTTLNGTQTISANASDAVSVSSVQFQVDGVNVGTADTTAPYAMDWDTTTVPDGIHSLRAIATNNSGLQTTSTPVSVTVDNIVEPPTAPTVAMTAPVAGSTINGTQTISANASDAVAVTSVQFQLDGADLGTAVTSAPYTFDLDTTTVADGVHILRAIATNNVGLQTISSEVSVTVDNTVPPAPTPPTVSLSSPAGGTINGTQTISANASDDVAVTSVQFQLDGVNLDIADTIAPYSVSWNTTTATNGTHTLRAIATNNAGLQTTSAPVSVTVNNVVTPPAPRQYVTNSSFETDLSQWTGLWSTNSASTRVTGGYSGTYAIRSVNTLAAATQHGFTSSPEVINGTTNVTTAGKVYTASVWVKPDVVGAKLNLYVRERNTAGTTVSSKTVTITSKTGWQQIVNAYTAVGSGNRISITVWAVSSAQNKGFLADLLSFTTPN